MCMFFLIFIELKMSDIQITKAFEGKLIDFDWQIRHVMGSSSCRDIEETFTLVSFLASGQTPYSNYSTRNIIVEFNKTEMKELINALQSCLLKMLSEEIPTKHQQICADLNLDKETATASWDNYLATKHNYTLEGNQLHWLACAIYVACRKSSTPAVGCMSTFIEGNLVSLTPLLRLCELTLIQFIDKCRKWANMVGLDKDFLEKIDSLERKLAVSNVVFERFRSIFYDMFQDQDANSTTVDQENMKIYKKGKIITCTTSRLIEFTWTLYLVVKSEIRDISKDSVSSYHLLLACCDLIYANAICSDRRDILNREFAGIPEHFFDDDYDPPSEPICVIDELCKYHEGKPVDAKVVREYSFKSQLKKLFERDIIKGDVSRFTDILNYDVFDSNYRSINRCYEQYVLSMGDFDERSLLFKNQSDPKNGNNGPQSVGNGSKESEKEGKPAPSTVHSNTLTPLTGRHHLKNRDGNINVGSVSPIMTAKESVIRLHTMLKTPRIPFKQSLKTADYNDEAITLLEEEIRCRVTEIMRCYQEPVKRNTDDQPLKFTEFPRKRLDIAEKLFYKMLDDIVQTEVVMSKPDIAVSLKQNFLLKSLFACSVEMVIFSYGYDQLKFPWVLEALLLPPYHFYKIIELVVRTESQLSRDMVKHLNMLEEKILDSLSWLADSPLWKTIDDSNMPVPSCEDVCLPHQLNTEDNQEETINPYLTLQSRCTSTESNDDFKNKPKRGGSLGLFFRKFYHLASVRMQDLCQRLNISEKGVQRTIWTCFEHVIVANVHLMKNRHLDQNLMCTVYVACKVLNIDLTFQEIMKCYRMQPQSASHIYRNVLLTPACQNENSTVPEERDNLIKFYNSVYVKAIQNFALKFSTKSSKGTPLVLSPLPVSKSRLNSPYRRVSDKHSIYIRCLDNSDSIAPSPVKPLSYYFSRSPAKDLHAINNMIQINTVKRSLTAMEDEELPIKKVSRHDSSKLKDMMEDRRKYKV